MRFFIDTNTLKILFHDYDTFEYMGFTIACYMLKVSCSINFIIYRNDNFLLFFIKSLLVFYKFLYIFQQLLSSIINKLFIDSIFL